MKKRLHRSDNSDTAIRAISVADLERYGQSWLYENDYSQHSKTTLAIRRFLISKLIWFLHYKNHAECGLLQLREFMAYCSKGHEEPGGRWGNPQMTRPVRPRTVHTYHGHLRTFFRWLVKEEVITSSPMERIPPPVARRDQLKPFR